MHGWVYFEITSQEWQVTALADQTNQKYIPHPDTSIVATDSALYQILNGQPRLISYASKRIQTGAQNYSLNELELRRSASQHNKIFSYVEESQFWYHSRPFSPNTYYKE